MLLFRNRRGLPFGNIVGGRERAGGSPGEAKEGFPWVQSLYQQQVRTKEGEAFSIVSLLFWNVITKGGHDVP
jgi:hypothetical protein